MIDYLELAEQARELGAKADVLSQLEPLSGEFPNVEVDVQTGQVLTAKFSNRNGASRTVLLVGDGRSCKVVHNIASVAPEKDYSTPPASGPYGEQLSRYHLVHKADLRFVHDYSNLSTTGARKGAQPHTNQ